MVTFGVILNVHKYCPHSDGEMTVADTQSPFDRV